MGIGGGVLIMENTIRDTFLLMLKGGLSIQFFGTVSHSLVSVGWTLLKKVNVQLSNDHPY